MKLAPVFFLALALAACATTSAGGGSAGIPGVAPGIRFEGGDGTSCATRVVIKGASGSPDGVAAEYAWLNAKYPGYKVGEQALIDCDRHPSDKLTATNEEGKTITVFFDVSDFFGKGFGL
jgi:hypothetical protein